MENDWLKLLYVGEELLCKKKPCPIGATTLWYYYYYYIITLIKVAHLIKPTAWLTLIDPGRASCICVGASWGP